MLILKPQLGAGSLTAQLRVRDKSKLGGDSLVEMLVCIPAHSAVNPAHCRQRVWAADKMKTSK